MKRCAPQGRGEKKGKKNKGLQKWGDPGEQ